MNKQRIWELDALRGLMIWIVVYIHLAFDFDYFLSIDLIKNPILQYCADHFGVTFVILSGLSVTIGSRCVRRGLQVFGCGMVITAVTLGMYLLHMADRFLIIYFGVLHLLGVCMMLWPLFRRLPWWALALIGTCFVGLGHWFDTMYVEQSWLFPLGLRTIFFCSGDYFPLFPHLGWFLLGGCVGKLVYKEKRTLLPRKGADCLPIRFLRLSGRRSIWIYLAHQPILYGIVLLMA